MKTLGKYFLVVAVVSAFGVPAFAGGTGEKGDQLACGSASTDKGSKQVDSIQSDNGKDVGKKESSTKGN